MKRKIQFFIIQIIYFFYKKLELHRIVEMHRNSQIELDKRSFKSIGTNSRIQLNYHFINPKYISIGNDFQSMYNLRIEAWDCYMSDQFQPEIIIGNNVSMNADVHIGCINKVVLSDNVLIASRVYITDHSHGDVNHDSMQVVANKRPLTSKGPVIIEENVWIGEGVCILSGVTIGKNSIIGANAVVTKSFPENSIIAGIPAKLIKTIS